MNKLKTEFKELFRDVCKRNDTKGNHERESKRYLENIESVLFNEGLTKKNVLFDDEFSGSYNIYNKIMIYSNVEETEEAILHVCSPGGNNIRRWNYNFYFVGNKKFKEKMKELWGKF